jgi:DnaJ-class molecular chaperone
MPKTERRSLMARKPTKPRPVKCPDCDGNGEITQAVRVGTRNGRLTDHRQTGLCLTCLGAGEIPADT